MFVGRGVPRNLYDVVSEESSAVVIRQYSSSFGLASRLLGEPHLEEPHLLDVQVLRQAGEPVGEFGLDDPLARKRQPA